MTDTEINVAIAEACGLNPVLSPFVPNQCATGNSGRWFSPEAAGEMRKTYPRGANPKVIPNYCADLNAMHDAEEHLKGETWANYFDMLQRTGKATGVRATARERAEAFLLTVGKWKEQEMKG